MHLVHCTHDRHAQAIVDIYNHEISHTTALYDYHPRPLAAMTPWFETKVRAGHPVIGLEADDGTLMGFATYGVFRERPAYKYSVEHSVYVHRDFRGRGIARNLMLRLINEARARDVVHVMVGVIDIHNTASIALHESIGFVHAGTLRQAGFKFGRWLDVGFWQLILPTPLQPVDG